MNYEEFKKIKYPFDNLYIIVRVSDDKVVLRGANYNSVIDLIGKDKNLYKIFFY